MSRIFAASNFKKMERILIRDISRIREAASEFISKAGILNGENRIFAFYGSMGAGKTTFITALCAELGVADVVNSPTFTIVNEYQTGGGRQIFHFDFYRIEKMQEVYDMGFEEYMYGSDGICLMEWPEKIEDLLPEETVKVSITELADGARELTFNS